MSESDSGTSVWLCNVDDVEDDEAHVGDVDGTSVAVFYIDGEYFAIDNTCPHQGGPLNEGKVENECVYCPWHGWEFDLESGEHVQGKASATTYDVNVEDDGIYVTV